MRLQQRALLLSLALIAAAGSGWLATVPRWVDRVLAPPLRVPLGMYAGSSLVRHFEAPLADRYRLRLEFSRTVRGVNADDLFGGAAGAHPASREAQGIGVPLAWQIAETTSGRVVAAGETVAYGAHSFSTHVVSREVAWVRLQPGEYVLRAEVTGAVPELRAVPTRIALDTPSGFSENPDTGRAVGAGLATALLVWPMTILSASVLAYRVLRKHGRNEGGGEASSVAAR